MALKKISIDGDKLREHIRAHGDSIKRFAEKVNIGEKTLHRLLNGEAIRRDKVEAIAHFLDITVDHILEDEALNTADNDGADGYRFNNGTSEITLTPFEKQHFFFKPYALVWKFDISPVNQKQLEIIESFESTVRDYLSKAPGHDGEFVQEFADLSMGVEIASRIDELEKKGLYAFFAGYTKYHVNDDPSFTPDGDVLGHKRHYRAQDLVAILITNRVKTGTVSAFVDQGEWPPCLVYNDDRKFLATFVNKVQLQELPAHVSREEHFDEDKKYHPNAENTVSDGKTNKVIKGW